METQKDEDILLEIEGLKQYFGLTKHSQVKAVDGVSFQIRKGEVYGLVGESGSGKTTIGRSIIHIYQPTEGKIWFDGEEITGKLSKAKKQKVTTQMQMIFQDPMASLNPNKKVGDIIAQGLDIHKLYASKKEREDKVLSIMEKVGLLPEYINRYPHQFSGGQRQRICIARAMVMNPKLIIADEPISALDVSIQAQVVNLLKKLQREMNTTYLFIAHDLAMVRYISDHIGVMHLGHMVETGRTKEIFENPVHPYTKSLLSSIPQANPLIAKNINQYQYNYDTSGINYEKGSYQYVGGEHYVLATEEERERWIN